MKHATRIGPYSLRRADLVAASLIISFRIGGRAVRIRSWLLASLCALLLASGAITGEWMPGLAAAVAAGFIFVGAAAIQSLHRVSDIGIEAEADALVAENAGTRTLYKWSGVRIGAQSRDRLFIMVTPNNALVVPTRAATPEQLASLVETIQARGGAA